MPLLVDQVLRTQRNHIRTEPQFREIYAPLDGIVVNGGIKITFDSRMSTR